MNLGCVCFQINISRRKTNKQTTNSSQEKSMFNMETMNEKICFEADSQIHYFLDILFAHFFLK